MGLTQNLGRLSPSIFSDASLNIGVGAAPSGSYKFEVTGTSKVSGVLTLGSTLSNGTYTYTLPAATGTLALTSDLTGYVTSVTASLPLSSSGGTNPNITISQATTSTDGYLSSTDWNTFNNRVSSSGTTGYIPKFSSSNSINNSGLYDDGTTVSLISRALSGSSASFGSSVTATSFVKTSGTSSQFLKADGSVDSTAYGTGSVTSVAALTIGTTGTDLSSTVATSTTTPVITLNVPTASATNRGALSSADWTTFNSKQATITLTTTGTSGAATFTSNTLNIPNYGSALSGYLPLTGGTLTGALTGTSATFSGLITSTVGNGGTLLKSTNATTSYQVGVDLRNTGGVAQFGIESSVGGTFVNGSTAYASIFGSGNATAAEIQTNGTVRLSIASTGAATFSSSVTTNGTLIANATNSQIKLTGGSTDAFIGISTSTLYLTDWATATKGLTINLSTGAATFSSSVTATQNVIQQTTDSDFLALKINHIPTTNSNTTVGYIGFYSNPGNGSNNTLSTGRIYGKFDSNAYASARLTFATVVGSDTYQDVMTLKDTNVGIGTISPSEKLTIYGAVIRLEGASGVSPFAIANNNSSGFRIYDYNAGVDRLLITSGGALCLGVTSAYGTKLLNVNGGIYATSSIAAVVASDIDMFVFQNTGASYTKAAIVASIAATGGTGSYFFYGQQSTSTVALKIFSNGNIQNTNNSYGAISDARLKENIKDATPKLDDLMKVKVRNYNLKGESNKQLGVISQELEAIFPNMIEESTNMGENMKIKGVKYSVFVPMLIKAVQELKAEIEILKNK